MSANDLSKMLQTEPAPILTVPQAESLIGAGYHKKVAALERKWASLLASHHADLSGLEATPQARRLRLVAIKLLSDPHGTKESEIREL